MPKEEEDVDLTVARSADGGDGCTLLASELFVGASTLLLIDREVLTSGAAIPREVSARTRSFLAGDGRSSRKPVDILRIADADDLLLAALGFSGRLGVIASGCAAFRDSLRSLRSGLRRWKPRLVSGLAGNASSRIDSPRGLCGGDTSPCCLAERALALSRTTDKRRPSEDRFGCGKACTEEVACAEAVAAALRAASGRLLTGLLGSVVVRGKNSVAVANVGSIEPSGDGLALALEG